MTASDDDIFDDEEPGSRTDQNRRILLIGVVALA